MPTGLIWFIVVAILIILVYKAYQVAKHIGQAVFEGIDLLIELGLKSEDRDDV